MQVYHSIMHARLGFTMIELILTLVLIGILSAIAVPRILAPSPFKVRALADEIAAEIRYTQQLNMNYDANATFWITENDGRWVMFIERDVNGETRRLHLRSRQDDGGNACPGDTSDPCRVLPSGFVLSSLELSFSRLGQPRGLDFEDHPRFTYTLSYADQVTTLCIEEETGFVDVRHGSGSCPP